MKWDLNAIIIGGCLIVVLIVLCVISYKKEKFKKYVMDNSCIIKAIKNEVEFLRKYEISSLYTWCDRVDSKRKFDKFNFNENVVNKSYFFDVINQYNKSLEISNKLLSIVSETPKMNNELFSLISVKYKNVDKFKIVEEKLIANFVELAKIKIPKFKYELRYTSPQGRNRYSHYALYDMKELISIQNRRIQEVEYMNSEKYKKKLERQKLSTRLRYEVLQRGNFKCVACGRTADDNIKLHVDHIKPIAKGGLTELDNLQILCEDCNLGKSDKY